MLDGAFDILVLLGISNARGSKTKSAEHYKANPSILCVDFWSLLSAGENWQLFLDKARFEKGSSFKLDKTGS